MRSKYETNYIEFPNIDSAYPDLQAGNLGAVVHDSSNVLYYVGTAGDDKVKSTGKTGNILPQQYGFVMWKNSSLTPKANQVLQTLRTDDTYDRIYVRQFIKQPKQPYQIGAIQPHFFLTGRMMNFGSRYIWDALPLLTQGLQLTLTISLSGLLGGLIIGLLAGTYHVLGGIISKMVSLVFVELIRGTPIMVQVMFIYFALPMVLPVRIDPVPAVIIAITINPGAYIAEITRGTILSINKGFREASLAMGLSPRNTPLYVIMPLTFRRIIPALGNQWITSIRDTSLFIVIGVAESTCQGQEVIAGNFRTLKVWTAVATTYLFLTLCLNFLLKQLEKRIHIL